MACVVGLLSGAAGLAVSAQEPEPQRTHEEAFDELVRPFLREYCTSCHSDRRHRGGLSLAKYEDLASVSRDRKTWEKVRRRLRAREMPPRKSRKKPESGERAEIIIWVEAELANFDCGDEVDPGRVTIRRLNRAEYTNTIRDLLGVRFDATEEFPADNLGYGFDTIGDVLSIPPLLMEKYLAAAETISRAAIVTPDPPTPIVRRFEAERLGDSRPRRRESVRVLTSQGQVKASYRFPEDGEYVLRVRAFGQQAGPDPVRMTLHFDGRAVRTVDVKATRDAPEVYETHITASAGVKQFAAAFVNDYYRPDDPDPANRDRNLVVDYLEVEGPMNASAGSRPLSPSHKRIMICEPGDGSKVDCARTILGQLARRAFRRPVSAAEVDRYVRFVDLAAKEGESFERGIQVALQAILVSPHFLFRIEQDAEPNNPEAVHAVGEFELASRLSYFLWSSMPDEELLREAGKGELHINIDAQVRRMLKDRKAEALVANFAGQWLETRNLEMVTPDADRFPDFDDALRTAMGEETERVFAYIQQEDRSILEFLDADYTFLNQRLARHYGISGVTGDAFRRVSVPVGQRGGILTHASVLTLTSNPTRTSPVKRGKWVLEQLLGAPPPPPPPDVPPFEEDNTELTGSLRERFEKHRSNPDCAVCHVKMDPIGFALENYDAIGAWRETDDGFAIDASGRLPGGESFDGPSGLKNLLMANKDAFCRCLAEKMLVYALGRGLEYYDKCAVDRTCEALAANNHRFSTLILETVRSVPFQMRRGNGDEE